MKIILLVLSTLFLVSLSVDAQKHTKGDTISISGATVEIKIPPKDGTTDSRNQSDIVKQVQSSIKSDLKDYTKEMQNQRFISDNVITDVNVESITIDGKEALIVTYSYTLKSGSMKFQSDDFGPGKYLVNESNALLVTLAVMKRNLEGQLARYVTPGKEISITINGSADAAPVKKVIRYKGEFGESLIKDCEFEGRSHQMVVTTSKGIKNNQTLAFLRSYAVRDYLKNHIFTKVIQI